jgi:DHA3 family macrolide efflux protein-like MFS transporter
MEISPHGPRTFAAFFTAQAASLFGSAVAQFALIWWLTERTHGSATALATAALAGTVPTVLIGPLAGALADRWDRRRSLILADGASAVVAAALALLAARGSLAPWHLYLALAVRGAAGALQFPAVQSATPSLVPPEQLTRISGLQQAVQSASAIAAPALGALLLMRTSLLGAVMLDIVTAAIAIGITATLRFPATPRAGAELPSLGRDLADGLRYVGRWPGLQALLLLATVLNLLMVPAFSLLPVFVKGHLHGGAPLLAGLEMAGGIGGIVGAVALGAWGGFRRPMATSTLGFVGIAAGCLALAAAPPGVVWPAWIGMALVGLFAPLCNGPIIAALQSAVAPQMLGRVMTLLASAAGGIAPLGLVVAGPLADRFGVPLWYGAGGVLCAGLSLVVSLLPALRTLDQGPPPA